jgi:deoxyribodipyrimidine photo-lyase
MQPPPVCLWLKRDLRVTDNPALATAVDRGRHGGVVAVFVYEPEVLSQAEWSGDHSAFQAECLRDLAPRLARLGVTFVTRRGEAVAALESLRRETGFTTLVAHEETGTGVTYARDRRVRWWARDAGVEFLELPQTGVVRRLRSRDGWNRLWERRMQASPAEIRPLGCRPASWPATAGILDERGLGLVASLRDRQRGGEAEAAGVLADFLDVRGVRYSGGLSSPVTSPTACSRLSAHLAFGTLSVRHVWRESERRRLEVAALSQEAADARAAVGLARWRRSLRAFQSRLHWHCHFMQKLEDEPELEFRCLQRSAEGLRDAAPHADRLAAWQEGLTGYPLVDACMRSVAATGWLTFRMRALVVSFASYTLWLPWRPTGLHLARLFLDFEPGIHWSQMQMQSGTTGINTLRIYNPVKQAHEHDPSGAFIRRWLPELARVPTAFIHEPGRMPASVAAAAGVRIGIDYPLPIVDHLAAVREAKARFAAVRGSPVARSEAVDVARRHGSRRDRRGAMQQDPVRRTLAGHPGPPAVDPQRRLPFAE